MHRIHDVEDRRLVAMMMIKWGRRYTSVVLMVEPAFGLLGVSRASRISRVQLLSTIGNGNCEMPEYQ
jgi:hypothetical protein